MTKYSRGSMEHHRLEGKRKPETYKHYVDALVVKLPTPDVDGGKPLWKIINLRSSRRNFSHKKLTMKELSQLLWAAQGITHTINGYELRASPSAGALYPIETYLTVNRVENLQGGIYHYSIPKHSLETLVKGDFSVNIAQAALDQDMARDAAAVFIWTAVVERCKWKYRQRAYRYIYLDAGHLAENIFLAAESLNIGACGIGALYDEEVNEMLGLNSKEETVIYMTCVGHYDG